MLKLAQTDPQRLHAHFDAQVPQEIQRALLMAVVDGYASTWTKCTKEFEEETQVQAWRFTRWIGIDSAMLGVGKRFKSSGVTTNFLANTPETDIRHAELRVGSIIITSCCVQERTELPRPAAYRNNLAQANQQTLFGTAPSKSDQLWVPIVHIPDASQKMPAAVYAAFPDGDGGYASEHVDLMARFPIIDTAAEKIADKADPTRRTQTEYGS